MVGKELGLKLANHEEISNLLITDSEVSGKLKAYSPRFDLDVADVLRKDGKKTIHHAVVSSQFDADRLDYMRRDRLMTGTQHAGIDFRWLLANLQVGEVETGVDDKLVGSIETFVLGPKAIHAAEAYVLGLFQLYPTVYFHKTTRGAERIFTQLLVKVFNLARDGKASHTGLDSKHPIIRFANDPENLKLALILDDTVIWGALSQMTEADDKDVSNFSTRLRDRNLYKCHDIRTVVMNHIDPKSTNQDEKIEEIDRCCIAIESKISEFANAKAINFSKVLIDKGERSPYKSITESKGPLDRINILTESGSLMDIKEKSSIVNALKPYKFFRLYASNDDPEIKSMIEKIVDGEVKKCRP